MPGQEQGLILVVDDEVELKNAVVKALTERGYSVVGCSSGNDALQALREKNFDVVLSDLMMPDMDGITLLGEAREIDAQLVGIIMTGEGTIQTAVEAMKLGAFDYLLKPFSIHALLPILTRAINVRRLHHENLHLRETVAIYELSQTIAFTLDPQTVLNKLADAAQQQTGADEVSILLPTYDGSELYVAVVRGGDRRRLLGQRIPLDIGVSGWVAREGSPLLLDGKISDPRFAPIWPRSDIRSAISVPLQIAGKLLGVINVNAVKGPRPFTLGQMKGLMILAGTAAAALESASLHVQVRDAEKNYHSIFENAVEGIFQSTPGGRFITVNPSLARILGYDSPKDVIASITDIKHQLYVDVDRWVEAMRIQEEHGILQGFEFEAYKKNGEKIWLSENRRAVRNETGVEIYREGSLEDITERKQAEETLRTMEEQLRQSQKLEAVGQLAGGIAHDFNNLLTVITGYSELALKRIDGTDPLRTSIEEIKKAGEKAAALTRQLLAFSRKQVLQPKVLSLNTIVADVDKMLRRLIGEDIDLLTLLDPSLGQIKADPGQIEQVIINLAVNARDAMPHGGKLTLEATNVYLDSQYAGNHVAITEGRYVMLALSDTGTGMDKETQAHIFEPFFTTKESGKGTGLGLSTVYGIVKQSGGYVWVYSEEGRGTTFKIYLPRIEHVAVAHTERSPTLEVLEGVELVLLAEDEEQVRKMTRSILEMHGYRVLEAKNGEEALAIYKEHGEEIGLILTDAVMPQMSGCDLIENLRPSYPAVKVLYMSGYTDSAIVRHGLLDQTMTVLQKPFTPLDLMRKVREVLDAPPDIS